MKQIDLPKGWLMRAVEEECRTSKNWPKCMWPMLSLNSELVDKTKRQQQNESEAK